MRRYAQLVLFNIEPVLRKFPKACEASEIIRQGTYDLPRVAKVLENERASPSRTCHRSLSDVLS